MERIHSLDVLKLIIACGVVWAHAMLMTNQGAELAYLFGQGLVRTVVPTFAVVSGFLFYFTLERGKAQVWLARLALFYLFWCAVYLPLWWPKAMPMATPSWCTPRVMRSMRRSTPIWLTTRSRT
jgi:surface polysaccharide O-acyltransferase-like enzyme